MQHSEQINELAGALAKAQGLMSGAVKDSSNPYFKSKYADLASVWDACRKPLTDNGLSVVQTADWMFEQPDHIAVETMLMHTSGQWIKGRLCVKPVKADPQSVGSCITYLRRYSLQSIVGIAPEDDDGNAASGKKEEPAYINEQQQATIIDTLVKKSVDPKKFLDYMKCETIETIPALEFNKAVAALRSAKGKADAAAN